MNFVCLNVFKLQKYDYLKTEIATGMYYMLFTFILIVHRFKLSHLHNGSNVFNCVIRFLKAILPFDRPKNAEALQMHKLKQDGKEIRK